MLTDEQRGRFTKNIGKRVRFRVQLKAGDNNTYLTDGSVSVFSITSRRGETVLQDKNRQIDDEYRSLAKEPGIHVGTYDPETNLNWVDEDIAETVRIYKGWGKDDA